MFDRRAANSDMPADIFISTATINHTPQSSRRPGELPPRQYVQMEVKNRLPRPATAIKHGAVVAVPHLLHQPDIFYSYSFGNCIAKKSVILPPVHSMQVNGFTVQHKSACWIVTHKADPKA